MELSENQEKFLESSIEIFYINMGINPPYYKLNENGLVDIFGHFNCSKRYQHKLDDFMGIKFGNIEGHFICRNHAIKTIEGMPRSVGGRGKSFNPCEFLIGGNLLESIEGILPDQEAPIVFFGCEDNLLTSTHGIPKNIMVHNYNFSKNKLTNLRDLEFIREPYYFSLYDNSFEGVSTHVLNSIHKVMVNYKCDFLTALTMRSANLKYWHVEDWNKMLADPYIRNWVKLTNNLDISTIIDMSKASLIVSRFEI